MKKLFTFIGVAGICLATAFITPKAQANGALVAFGTTNSIDSSTATFTSWPVNGTTTNALTYTTTNGVVITTNTFYPGLLTGKAIAIYNQEHLVLNVQGFLVNTAAATMTITLNGACTGGNGPANGNWVNFINTNGIPGIYSTNVTQNDWETTGHAFALALPAQTNWFNFQTNIVMDVIGSGGNNFPNADFIGITTIANTLTAGCFLSNPNGVVFLNKKLIPTPLIGQ
jgi:hypothetical protein